MYDIFFITDSLNNPDFLSFKERFPLSKAVDSLDTARKRAFTKFFWIVWPDIIVDSNFDFNYKVSEYDTSYTHVFKNKNYFDGICLIPKNGKVSGKEFTHRFFFEKKEIDIQASVPKPYDIVFISYNEPNAEENFKRLIKRFPNAKRVDKVKGIHQAHIEAAKLVSTKMFWVVDGDAVIVDSFNFDHQVATWDLDCVHVWRSKNPVNGLEYGYGGVKLLPKKLTLEVDTFSIDMTTSISHKFKAMNEVSNITAFDTDAFSTWRSAFRECVKLASKTIDRQHYEETANRLTAWLTFYPDKPFAQEAAEGAFDGREYGRKNAADPAALTLINDFDWLKSRFEQSRLLTEKHSQ